MAVIRICELEKTETSFDATLIIEGNSYPIIVKDPFITKQEQELEWYFEDWLIYPMLDNVKADRAKASIKKYGEVLFRQVFQANSAAYSQYKKLCHNQSQLTLEIISINPEFQAIHWEALHAPESTHPLAIDTILIRKSIPPKNVEIKVKESPNINLLVVVARPNAEDDIPHRTISRPLIEVILKSKLRVNIEILRPGTYEALVKHLEARGNGYYHIVHFDVHGSLQNYETYQERLEIGMYPQSRYGREEIEEYDGFKAFLALEGEEIGEYDPVEASEIANLLTSKDIPVCILNACQSGKQLNQAEAEDNRETSLGSRLMNAGMQMVVAMSYSVTPRAAEIMMQRLYEHLFDEQDINQAILLGRKELYNSKARKAAYNTEIDLEDWLLPVVYSNGEITFNLREFTPEEETEYNLCLESKYTFAEPNYGFVGRDIDILLIEKALLQQNILLLQGMGGTGKTTLLKYLQEWWQVTKFAEDIFYFAYDKRAYTLQQIIFEISKQLYNQFDFERFQAKNISEQYQEILHKLLTNSYVLILDNLESITGQPLAIQNRLEKPEREKIKNFLASLVDGKTKVILGSRIAEEWLEASTFQDNSYQLRGLDSQASSDLAANVLQKIESSQSLDDIKIDEHFQQLMKLLAGNPLAIKVILPNLKDKSPKEVLEELSNAEISPGGDDKESNILKCIEYSYQNLSGSAQKLILLLAPFQGFICSLFIPQYVEKLVKLKPFQDYDLEQLEIVVAEAVHWGLLSPINQDLPEFLTIQPILPYFLKTKLKEIDAATRKALQEGFKNYYKLLAFSYSSSMESKEPQGRKIGIYVVGWEYENLYQSLQICLAKKESVYLIWKCLYDYLDFVSDKREQLKLTQNIYNSFKAYKLEKPNTDREEDLLQISFSLASCYQKNQDYQMAKNIYENTLELISQFGSIEDRQKKSYQARIINNLGIVAQKSREYEQAQDYFNQALSLKIKFGDRSSQANTLHQLGRIAQELRKYEQAQDYFNQALSLQIEFGDRFSQATTLHNLGMVAQELREYKQAQDYFNQALSLQIEFGDRFSQAGTLHQLGMLAQELREYEQAQDYFNQAFSIKIEFEDRFSQATTLHQLGMVAQKLREYEQAQDYLNQAFSLQIEFEDRFSQATTLHQLGMVAQELREYEQAQDYFNQALSLQIEFGDRFSQATTLHQLGMVAQELREYEQAQDYLNQALSLQIEFEERFSQATTLHNLGVVSQELKKYEQAQDYLNQALSISIKFGDIYGQATTLHHLGSIAQELKKYEQAQDYLNQALSLKIELGNSHSQAKTYSQLGLLAEELSEWEQAKNYYLQALEIFIEFEDEQYSILIIKNLANVYKKNQDDSIVAKIKTILQISRMLD